MLSKIIITTVAVSGTSALIYLTYLHRSLSRRIHHFHFVGQLPLSSLCTSLETLHLSEADSSISSRIHLQLQTIQSLPPAFHTIPQNYHVFYDSCYKTIPASDICQSLASDPSQMLTHLLRRNMALFATRLPQAWLLRFLISWKLPLLLPSFNPEHLQTLNFEPGDMVAGVYRVVVRTPTQVEFDMWVPPQSGIDLPPVEGRLIFDVGYENGNRCDDSGQEVTFRTTTLQWRSREQEGVVLPLERGALRFLHHIASWWLLESGVTWLGAVGGKCKSNSRGD